MIEPRFLESEFTVRVDFDSKTVFVTGLKYTVPLGWKNFYYPVEEMEETSSSIPVQAIIDGVDFKVSVTDGALREIYSILDWEDDRS